MKIGVILPSRGLMFSKTADELLQNLKGVPHKFFFSHRRPIPDCFEIPTREALADESITHLWFVEDDMILKPNTLKDMLEQDKAVVTADYPVTKDGKGAVFKAKGQVIFCGTGCLLVKREVFDELKTPYFRTDVVWNIKNFGQFIKFTAIRRGDVNDGYGLHDINFCMKLNHLKIPIHQLPYKLGQRKLIELGKAGSNDGAHVIEEWTKVKSDYVLKQVKKWPIQPSGDLVTVFVNGEELSCTAEHAKKLIRKGLATRPPRKYVVIDDSEAL